MSHLPSQFTACLALAAGFSPLATHAAWYAVSSLGKTEIVGTTSAVPFCGETTNFSAGTVSVGTTHAKFRLIVSGTNTRFAGMKVTLVEVNGTLDTSGSRTSS